jgi:hypothetical protein
MTEILRDRNKKFAAAIQSEYEAERIKTQSRYKHLVQERLNVQDMKDAGDKAVQGEAGPRTLKELADEGDSLLADDTSVADERLKALRTQAREADFEQYCRDLYRATKGNFSAEAFMERRKITHPELAKVAEKKKDSETKAKEAEPPHCYFPVWSSLPPHIQDILESPGFGEVRKYPGMYQFRRAIKKPTPHRSIEMPPTERAELRKQKALNPRLDVNEMSFEELILDQYRRYKVDDLARTKTFNDWMGLCTDRLPSYRCTNPYVYAFDDMDLRYPDKKFSWRYQHYMDNNDYSPTYWYHSYNTYRGVVPGQCKPYHQEESSDKAALNLEYVQRRRHVDFPRYGVKYSKYVFLDAGLANHTSHKNKEWAKQVSKFYETENPLATMNAEAHEALKYDTKKQFEELTGRPALLRRDALFQKKSERDALTLYLKTHNVRLEKDKFLDFLDSGCKLPKELRDIREGSSSSGGKADELLDETGDLGFKVDLLADRWQGR